MKYSTSAFGVLKPQTCFDTNLLNRFDLHNGRARLTLNNKPCCCFEARQWNQQRLRVSRFLKPSRHYQTSVYAFRNTPAQAFGVFKPQTCSVAHLFIPLTLLPSIINRAAVSSSAIESAAASSFKIFKTFETLSDQRLCFSKYSTSALASLSPKPALWRTSFIPLILLPSIINRAAVSSSAIDQQRHLRLWLLPLHFFLAVRCCQGPLVASVLSPDSFLQPPSHS